MKDPIVLVLCGGDGTRLGRFGLARHKCLLPVDDGEPVFARHVRAFPKSWRVYANVPERWKHAYEAHRRALGLHNLRLLPIPSPPRGSGATLAVVARANPGRDVFVCYGDTWLSRKWYDAALVAPRSQTWVGAVRVDPNAIRPGGLLEVRSTDLRIERVYEGRVSKRVTHWHVGIQHYSAEAMRLVARRRGRRDDVMRDCLPSVLGLGAHVLSLRRDVRPSVADLGTPGGYAAFVALQYVSGNLPGFVTIGPTDVFELLLDSPRIILAGNGGACAVAQHAAIDWQKAGGLDIQALADAPATTAWANDHGYDGALARQVERVSRPEECALVLFSASGASPNVVEAARRARELGFRAVVSVSHADASAPLHSRATHQVLMSFDRPSGLRGYAKIEDAMQAWCHAVAVAMAGLQPWTMAGAEGASA